MPYAVQVQFRTASSFLVAYSVNLSRGGLFVETEAEIPTGAMMALEFDVPGAGATRLNGVVAWRRGPESATARPGSASSSQDLAPTSAASSTGWSAATRACNVLVLSADRHDRTSLTRIIKSIIGTAEIARPATRGSPRPCSPATSTLAVIDVDADPEGALDRAPPREGASAADADDRAGLDPKKLASTRVAAGADEVARTRRRSPSSRCCCVRARPAGRGARARAMTPTPSARASAAGGRPSDGPVGRDGVATRRAGAVRRGGAPRPRPCSRAGSAIVIGPTPPGTGVIRARARGARGTRRRRSACRRRCG